MFDDLNGKAVLITGASTGIGAAVARAFGRLGARVGVHCNSNLDAAEAVAADVRAGGGEAVVLQGDVAERAQVERIVEEFAGAFGGLDVLINNAGTMFGRTMIVEADDERYDKVMDVNARSVFLACRAAVPLLRRRGGGSIINTTSIAARTGGGAGAGLYGSAKAFVSTLTRVLAREHATEGIRVNGVAPGVIATPFHERYSNDEQLEAARRSIPMGRLGTAEDCVGAYLFLASAALSGYITGQIIEVNGGQLMP